MADAAGAVEIDELMLKRIEDGSERPSEDILLLLINHFSMADDEADRLWELAGYEPPEAEDDRNHDQEHHATEEPNMSRAAMLVLAIDPRVTYSDGVQVNANSKGVVMSFAQAAGTPQALTTARIGMSRDQAYRVLEVLQQALKASEPRLLPGKLDTPQATTEKPTDQPKI